MAARTIVYSASSLKEAPDLLTQFCREHDYVLDVVEDAEGVQALLNRSFPSCLVLDCGDDPGPILELCSKVKGDILRRSSRWSP